MYKHVCPNYQKYDFGSWVLSFLKYKKISNQSTLLSYYVIHSNKIPPTLSCNLIFCIKTKEKEKKCGISHIFIIDKRLDKLDYF